MSQLTENAKMISSYRDQEDLICKELSSTIPSPPVKSNLLSSPPIFVQPIGYTTSKLWYLVSFLDVSLILGKGRIH